MWLGARCGSHAKGMLAARGGDTGRDYQDSMQQETLGDRPGEGHPGRTGRGSCRCRAVQRPDVDAALDESALGQLGQLLPHGQGDPVMLEGFPGLARGQPR